MLFSQPLEKGNLATERTSLLLEIRKKICLFFKELSRQHFSKSDKTTSSTSNGATSIKSNYDSGMLIECASIVKKLVRVGCQFHNLVVVPVLGT